MCGVGGLIGHELTRQGEEKSMDQNQNNGNQAFFDLGNNVFIEAGFEVSYPKAVSIGELTYIQKDCFFNIPNEQDAGFPRIEIQENCSIGKRCVISAVNRVILEDRVILGANVHVSDHDHEYREVGVPIMFQGATVLDATVTIGRGSWIANNGVIIGDVHIGRGCVVGANSVVTGDIPDYCVAVGSPARVIKCFDPVTGTWLRVRDQGHLTQVLRQRQQQKPVLSVCVLTDGDLAAFETCMSVLCKDAGNDRMLDIVVCDNGADKAVTGTAQAFCSAFDNVRLVQDTTAEEFDRRYLRALAQAKGEFVTVIEDKDGFAHNGVYHILHALFGNRTCSVLLSQNVNQMFSYQTGSGWGNYANHLFPHTYEPFRVTFQTQLVNGIADKARKAGTGCSHLFLQYRCLSAGQAYCIATGIIFMDHGAETAGTDRGRSMEQCRAFVESLSAGETEKAE